MLFYKKKMGICETIFDKEKDKDKNNKTRQKEPKKQNNKGSNLFCAPINSSTTNDNIYVEPSMSQMTMTMDNSHYIEPKRPPQIYQYINRYKTNGLQKSVAKASLVELGGQANSLMVSNIKNSRMNQTSIYTSRIDETGYESSYDGVEMIVDGKMDEDLVKQSTDKNTLNNYNEFIKKKEDNNNNKKVMDYYHKTFVNNNNNNNNNNKHNTIDESKDGDDLSGIPPVSYNNKLNKKNSNKDTKDKMQKYLESMGKY